MLIFKPEAVGDYEVNLSIEDISDEVVAKEIYYFKVIPETTEVSIVEPQKTPSSTKQSIPKNKHAKKTRSKPSIKQNTTQSTERKKQRRKSPITQNKYAIQISAWPSLEEARQHQLELLDAGFDAYTQRFYFQKKDEVWYRVRIGHFKNKEIALSVMEQIESSTNIKTWLDILSTK
jgi:cell division septation protein DedD